ncbi:shikimate dehydrogenase [Maricaulis sp.]|uniref:shikimate dehydrogenase n=1 Tax=Maricaulis sp. TaxID=1486257 RepID=UPI002603D7CF|nr:shikimate dehydrogenase [Maricaulis sp.]
MKPTGAAMMAGVIGQPIAHSLSPLMMAHWIEAAGLNALYGPYIASPHMFAPVALALQRSGLSGLNVTLPHKEQALVIAHRISDRADAIGAANLLTFADGEVHADNTDAPGFIGSLKASGGDPAGQRVLVLGAGGAARSIVYGLVEAGASSIIIANRNRDRAKALRDRIAPAAEITGWDGREEVVSDVDIVVNATSLGLTGQPVLDMDFTKASKPLIVADSVYSPLKTAFLRTAEEAGHKTVDGLGMLIEQGKPSFEAFFGQPAPDVDVRTPLMAALGETP